jgi:hypothetical protein
MRCARLLWAALSATRILMALHAVSQGCGVVCLLCAHNSGVGVASQGCAVFSQNAENL